MVPPTTLYDLVTGRRRAHPGHLRSVPAVTSILLLFAVRQHDIEPRDHVLLTAAPEYGVVIVHTRQAMNEMLARYHSTFTPPDPAPA
jgi:hypothetical protein